MSNSCFILGCTSKFSKYRVLLKIISNTKITISNKNSNTKIISNTKITISNKMSNTKIISNTKIRKSNNNSNTKIRKSNNNSITRISITKVLFFNRSEPMYKYLQQYRVKTLKPIFIVFS